MPTTQTSAGSTSPVVRRTPVSVRALPSPLASNPAMATEQRSVTPWSRMRWPRASPSTLPRPRWSGTSAASSTVTSQPSARALLATSAPMKPAPMTQTRGLLASASRSARAWSSVRSSNRPCSSGWSGRRRARAPVARMSAP
jgi:hypothetical protein